MNVSECSIASKTTSELLSRLAAQREKIAGENLFGKVTENIGEPIFGLPKKNPIAEHPRLLLSRQTLPLIRKSLEEDNLNNREFKDEMNKVLESEGVLGDISFHGINATVGGSNIHNFESEPLRIIQAKALAYLIYEEPSYGYEAILYLKNFLLSLNIKRISSDQCRIYGFLMFTAALVYDWCYDLLTDEDKEQIIAGVEWRVCRMKNEMTPREGQVVMEVGFPPAGQGTVVGHGSERQILRDYLSFATAIYGENDSWWNYIAGRVYNCYVPPRNYYFKSGVAPQGPYYGSGRHISDLYSAWILKIAVGENPYVGMENTVRGFLGYEYANGFLYSDGDGHAGDGLAATAFTSSAYISAYLYGDEAMLAQAEFLQGGELLRHTMTGLDPATYVALRGLCDIKPSGNRYEGMPLIQYNPAPLGQYIIRDAHADKARASAFMRIKERTTGNHEHCDSGTFEIFYKTMLTNKGGRYNNYGHPQTAHYYRATISHNGLIVFNPDRLDPDNADPLVKYYSGGNIRRYEPNSFEILMRTDFDMGKVVGREHAYDDKEETKPRYAYIAGDISKAYYDDTAKYVGRRMITVYTDNEDFPMALFVYDDVESVKPEYEKKFLLQISSSDEPAISEENKTITTDKGEGRLVLNALTDGIKFISLGGRNEGEYSAAKSRNYMLNGSQCVPRNDAADDGHWGRVEIVPDKTVPEVKFMNLLYVTDAGQTKPAPIISRITGEAAMGGVFGNIAAIFATSRDRVATELSASVSGDGDMSYYVSGVAAGTWEITVNEKSYGAAVATEEGGLLTFTAPAGSITLKKSIS